MKRLLKPSTWIIAILVVVTSLQLFTVYQASQKINQLQAENARLSMELSYLEGKYQEKYVFVDTPDGEQLARLVSIDGGKNYVEINRQREILYPPYFKQRYPGQELAELRTLPHKTR